MRIFVLLLTYILSVSTSVINYLLHEDNGYEVNECIDKAMEILNDETCLIFQPTSGLNAIVTFIQSGHCSWQESNRTVHLNPDCISDDICFEIIGRALEVNKPKDLISRHLNVYYNCTEKCTVECKYGGVVQDDCSCKCSYGFSGQRCEHLAKISSFTDTSCGIIEAQDEGVVNLSTYPNIRPKSTFCQWLIRSDDPWVVIDVEIDHLGLDGEDLRPGTKCNDFFTAFGEQEEALSLPCDGSKNVTHLQSKSNWLLLELRTDPYSENSFTGPNLRYSVKRLQPGVRIYSEGMTASSRMMSVLTFVSYIVVYSLF